MPNLYDDRVLLQKFEQAIQDLGELEGRRDPQRQKLMQFLRETVEESRELGRVYDQSLGQAIEHSDHLEDLSIGYWTEAVNAEGSKDAPAF